MVYPILVSLFFALIFAILIPSVFSRKGPGPWNGILFFFLLIFFFAWAIGSWTGPIGPEFLNTGTTWLDYLLIALFVMLLIVVLIPPRRRPTTAEEVERQEKEEQAAAVVGVSFGIFFWLLLLILLVVGIISLVQGGA